MDGWMHGWMHACMYAWMHEWMCVGVQGPNGGALGWHLNISVTPSDFRPLPHPFILYSPWRDGSSLSLGLGQPWPCLDPIPLLAILFAIAFHLQLVLLSYHPIFLLPYHFLKLVSFLEL